MKKKYRQSEPKPPRVGVREIDEQHKRLNNLIASISNMCGCQEKIKNIEFAMLVKQTLYYVNYHVKYEVGLMEETAYPAIEEHLKFHKIFFMNFLDHIRAFESQRQFSPEKLPPFLLDWLNTHYLMDRDISQHIKSSKRQLFFMK